MLSKQALMALRALSRPAFVFFSACSSGDPAPAEQERWQPNPLCERIESVPYCTPRGFEQCSANAVADASIAVDDPTVVASAPYDNADCPGRFVVDLETEDFVPTRPEPRADYELPVWVASLWEYEQIDTAERCRDVVIDVAIERELTSGVWQVWDEFRVLGDWTERLGACEVVHCGGGRYPDGTLANTKAAPQTWVDIEDTRRVRFALALHDSACTQYDLRFFTSETL
jgi:hypothetical protein